MTQDRPHAAPVELPAALDGIDVPDGCADYHVQRQVLDRAPELLSAGFHAHQALSGRRGFAYSAEEARAVALGLAYQSSTGGRAVYYRNEHPDRDGRPHWAAHYLNETRPLPPGAVVVDAAADRAADAALLAALRERAADTAPGPGR